MVFLAANEVEERSARRMARMAEVAGQLNALHAELVELTGEAVADQVDLDGYASGVQFVAHRTGCAPGRARAVTMIANRRAVLPVSFAAFRAGRLSVDQMHAIARRVPASHDEQACELALVMTPAQLHRVFARYPWPDDADPVEAPAPSVPPEPVLETTAGWDDDGSFILRSRLDGADGAVVDTALSAHRDALFQDWKRDRSAAERAGEAFTVPMPTLGDALVRMADRSLAAEAADRPHHRRVQALVHLDVDTPHARLHLGPALPASLRRLLSCDATYRVLYERAGIPLGIGRTSHTIAERTRTAVEDRDGGCRAPACGSRHVQIHHVEHWEDGGPTDTANLIALCARHHRMHHAGRLGISGTDADDPDGITFHRPGGRPFPGVSPPTPPPPGITPPVADHYVCPEHGRLDPRWITFHP
jgi:hypothetical protein